jgi:hypothetical protein
MKIKTLDQAVDHLIFGLDAAERDELRSVAIVCRASPGHEWIRRVISVFHLDSVQGQELIFDIDIRCPDQSAMKFIESDRELPIFEAKVIVREAQKKLSAS